MSERQGESIWPVSPKDPALKRILAKQREEEAVQKQTEIDTDERMSRIRETEDALAFAAGLTRDGMRDMFAAYGSQFGTQIWQALIDNKATNVEEAIQYLYQQAGDQAGAYADWLAKITNKKVYHPAQRPTAWEQLNMELYQHEHPQWRRRKKRPGKIKVIEKAQRHMWRQEQQGPPPVTPADDLAFEQMVGQPGPAKRPVTSKAPAGRK